MHDQSAAAYDYADDGDSYVYDEDELAPVITGTFGQVASANEESGTVPPKDEAAERAILGSMLISQDAVADVVEVIRSGDFYHPAHSIIFEAIVELFSRGTRPDALTVADELAKHKALGGGTQLAKVGGATYLNELATGIRVAANAAYYAKIVHERAMLRRLIEAGTRIVQLAYAKDGGDPAEIINMAQSVMYGVADGDAKEDYVAVGTIVDEALTEIEAAHDREGLRGIPTGFNELDKITQGLHPGQMIVIAARPGLGKSTLALDFARNAAVKDKRTTAFFSLEMPKIEILQRLLSAEAGVLLNNLRSGDLKPEEWDRIWKIQDNLKQAPLFIDDSANLSLMEIRAKARRIKQQHGLELVVIDYLQLMTSGKAKIESRQQEVSEFSRSLKLLAKELNIPVIALSQLNRDSEKTDREPRISDLRESGSIEQDADAVILLHRDTKDENRQDEADLILAKHRNGPTGKFVVQFQGRYSRFVEFPDTGQAGWPSEF